MSLILFLAVSFVAATVIQLLYWTLLFSKLIAASVAPTGDATPPRTDPSDDIPIPPEAVSVVLCARNEAKNLLANLPRFLNQNYRSFEILVVNDQSTDNTEAVCLEIQKKYSYLRIINNSYIKKYVGKKEALALGLREAAHEIVAVTDADCSPISDNWLATMQSHLQGDKEIVLGYGPYRARKGWLNAFIRFETIMTAIQYFSYSLAGIPYMGVGRNMMYRKSLFAKANGFESHQHIASGDDDLFIKEVATSKNVAISLHPDSFIFSEAQPNLHTFFRQKTRHLSTGIHYKWQHKILLGLYGATQAWHYFALILLIFCKNFIYLAIILYLLRIFTVAFISAFVLKKLQEQSILTRIVWLDAAMALYYALAAPLPFIAKTRTWK
jgi:poly-beta-1,6-N-acetyl-D-glucosamine synthase